MHFDFGSLRRSTTDRECAGVCGGLGEHSPVPSWAWRALFILGALGSCWVLVVYLLLSCYMPAPAASAIASREPARA